MKPLHQSLTMLRIACAAAALLCAGAVSSAQAATYCMLTGQPYAWDSASTNVVWDQTNTAYPIDDDKQVVNMGFNFTFAGVSYSQVRIMSNGLLQFGPDQAMHQAYLNQPLPTPVYLNFLAPYWDDLDPAIGGTVRYSLLGSAPNRRFVVSWENVPVYGGAGSYTFQAILYENGDIKFQYGAGSADGSSATIGVQVSPTDATQYSYNTASVSAGSAILFSSRAAVCGAAGLVAEYHMDEASWGGVIDSSVNANNATAVGGAAPVPYPTIPLPPGSAIPANPGTCGAGRFPASGTNAVATPLNPATTLGNTGTIAFWYSSNSAWNDGTARMLFDASNNRGRARRDRFFFLAKRGNGSLVFLVSDNSGAITSAASPPLAFAANTWHHVAAAWDVNVGLYIYVDGVLVASSGGNNNSNGTMGQTNTLYIGDNRTGGVNTSGYTTNPANGYIDEVLAYSRDLSAAEVAALRTQTHACPVSLTHYAINLPGGSTGLTCEPSQVRIAGHDAGHVEVAPAAGTVLTLGTSTGAGVWVAGLVSGTGSWTPSGANNGQASYIWPGGETNFTVRLRQNTPATLSVNLLDSGGRNEASTEDPSLTFADTAFRVTDSSGTAVATLGTQLAGKPSNVGFGTQTRYLQAMRTDTNTGACATVFQNQTVSVGLAGAHLNPTGGASALAVRNSGGAMQAIATGAGGPGAYTGVSLAFDAQSKAPLVVSYPDAGSVQLYASYALPAPPAATTMTGSSNAFVVRPFGLRVSGVTTAASPSPASPVFAKAGANFNVTLSAVAWKAGDDANADGVPDNDAQIASNAATPNFDAAATLSHSLNAPAGGNAGTLGGGTSFSAFSAGAKTQSVNWSEVGFIDLHALSTNYLGSGQAVTNSSAGLTGVGRFIPDHLTLSGGVLTNRVAAACAPASAFSYLGEGIRLQYTLTAQNAANATTQNYTTASGFAKLPTVPAGMGFGAVNGATNLSSRLDLGNSGALGWSTGAASVDYTLAVNRASPDNPDGPFAAAKIGVAPADGDGVGLASAAYDMDVDNNSVNEHQQVGASTQLRFGRIEMDNALGPDGVAVPVPITAEYWNGATFATNTLDSCTRIPRGAIILDGYDGALAPGGGNCKTFVQQNPVTFSAGGGTLTLAPPPAGVTGSVRLTPNLGTVAAGNYCASSAGGETPASAAVLPYLLGRWNDLLNPDGNPNTMYDDNPSARAAFGLYGSQPDNLIFQRENY